MQNRNTHKIKSPHRIHPSSLKMSLVMGFSLLLFLVNNVSAQVINNNGAVITIVSATVVESDTLVNSAGNVDNEGIINLQSDYINKDSLQGGGRYNIGGNWTNTGISIADTSTVHFNGNATQIISSTEDGGEVFYNLIVNNSGSGAGNSIILSDNVTVSENLNLNLGNVETGPNKLYLSNLSIASLDYSSTTESRIIGKFERGANTIGQYLFPIGSNANYNPLNLTINSDPTAGSVLSEYFEGDPLGGAAFPIFDNEVEVYEQYPDGYWGLKAENSFASDDFDLSLEAAGFIDFHDIASIIKRPVGGDWVVDGGHKDASGLEAYRDTLRAGIDNTMGNHFAFGHTRPRIWTPPIDTIVCDGDIDFFSVAATGRGDLTYQWLEDRGSGWVPLSETGIYSGTTDSILTILPARDSMDAYRYMVDIRHKYGHLKESDSVELWVNLLALSATVSDQLCDDINSYGSIDAVTTGGSSQYYYSWKSPNLPLVDETVYDSITMDGFLVGLAYVTILDSIGCLIDTSFTIEAGENPLPTPSIPDYGSYQITCADSSNGAIYIASISGKGGTNPDDYTFEWFDNPFSPFEPMIPEQDVDSLSGLSAGDYRVVITDTLGCFFDNEWSWTITEPPPIKLAREGETHLAGFDISCFGESDGIINIDVIDTDNARTIDYAWSTTDGDLLGQTNIKDVNSLIVGTYDFTVTDEFGCFADTSITLISPTQIVAALIDSSDYNTFEISCNSLSDAFLNISTTGGFGGYDDYEFEWQAADGVVLSDQENISSLSAGTYTLTITDSINCLRSFDYILQEPDVLSIDPVLSDFNNFNISCFNGDNGLINLQPDGGVESIPYIYSWTGPGAGLIASDENQAGLSAGVYNILLTDDNGCNDNWNITLTEPEILMSSITSMSISCFSNATGSIDLDVNGGVDAIPYEYLWTPGGETSEDLNSLTVGEYSVIITDANNCVRFDTAIVPEPPDIIIELTSPGQYNGKMISCFGESDATINSTVYGGVGEFDYRWLNDNQTSTGLNNVPAGWYYLEVTDDNECINIDSIEITQPLIMSTELFETDPSCYAYNDGFITVIPQGGTPAYTIFWDEADQTGQKADSITAGTYNVSIYDLNNCRIDTVGILNQPDSMYIIKDITQPYCPDTRDGIIDLEVFGGTYPYTLNWSDKDKAGGYLEDLTEGTYTLEIVDNNLCVIHDTTILRGVNISCLFIPTAFTPDGDGYNEVWEIGLIEIYPEAIIEIFNRWGTLIYVSDKGYTNPWNGTFKGRPMPIDSYYFVLIPGPGKEPVTGNVTIIR